MNQNALLTTLLLGKDSKTSSTMQPLFIGDGKRLQGDEIFNEIRGYVALIEPHPPTFVAALSGALIMDKNLGKKVQPICWEVGFSSRIKRKPSSVSSKLSFKTQRQKP